VLFYVLFVCKCVLPPGDKPIAVNKYIITINLTFRVLESMQLKVLSFSRNSNTASVITDVPLLQFYLFLDMRQAVTFAPALSKLLLTDPSGRSV